MEEPDLKHKIGRYLDGRADPAERDELRSRLAQDPDRVQDLLRAAEQDAVLGSLLRKQAGRPQSGAKKRTPAGQPAGGPERPRRLARWIPIAAAAAIFAVFFLVRAILTVGLEPIGAFAAEVSGSVDVVRQGEVLAASAGMPLAQDDLVLTGTGGRIMLAYEGEDTTLTLGGDGRLRVWNKDRARQCRLELGRLAGDIAPQPADRPFRIFTPQAEAEILGTRFTLEIRGDRTRLEVSEGRIRLTQIDGQESVEVESGEFGMAKPGLPLAIGGLKPDEPVPDEPVPDEPVPDEPAGLKVVFVHDFDKLNPGERSSATLVVLEEQGNRITAIRSRPQKKAATGWNPDNYVHLNRRGAEVEAPLFVVPPGMCLRFRVKSERRGRLCLTVGEWGRANRDEHFSSDWLQAGPEWTDIVLGPDDLKPYRRPGIDTPDFDPGMEIEALTFHGFDAGTFWIDKLVVTQGASP